MTLKEVIRFVDDIKPNAFSNAQKTQWINQVEGMVQTEVFLRAVEGVQAYAWPADRDTELLVHPPNDKLYLSYLTAMIDYANGEYDRYQNTMQMFNGDYSEFAVWFADRYRPADTNPLHHGRRGAGYGDRRWRERYEQSEQ